MVKGVLFTEQARADIRAIEQPAALQILKTMISAMPSRSSASATAKKPTGGR